MNRSKGIKKSFECREIWNKGKTKDTDERIKNLIENRDMSYLQDEDFKKKRSEISKGTSWFNNGEINIRLHDNICPDGFVPGMKKRKRT